MQSLDAETEAELDRLRAALASAEGKLEVLENTVRAHRATRVPTQWTPTERAMFQRLAEN